MDNKQTNLKYDVTGKIVGIFNEATFNSLMVCIGYDEIGNRIRRTDKMGTTYYVYNANFTVRTIYKQTLPSVTPVDTEVPFYGSGRLGFIYTETTC